MINVIIPSLIPLTIILAILLFIRQPLRKKTDASTIYSLWLLLPFSLIMYSLELPWYYVSELNNVSIQTYLVQPSMTISLQLTDNNMILSALKVLWLTGFFALVLYWLIVHFSFKKLLNASVLSNTTLPIKLSNTVPEKLSIKQSHHIHSPMLMGLMQPTLVIPEDFNELYSPEQQELIIAHEVCTIPKPPQDAGFSWN